MQYFMTGDIHGDVSRIENFCNRLRDSLVLEDTGMIVLGDCGFNYFQDVKDSYFKEKANNIGIQIICVKGNHELWCDVLDGYKTKMWNGAPVYYEEEYPNLIFLKDGEIYDLNGAKVFVMGGAYSVDKEVRLMMGYRWFESEQPSEETKFYGLKTLDKVGWDVDYVLSHTAPLRAEPRHLFLEGLDQSKIDKSTEEYLDEIAEKLNFKRWFFGHYHGEWTFDKYQMLFTDIIEFPALEK